MATFDDVERLTSGLPEVTVSTSYGTPALKVRGKLFCRLWGERDFHKSDVSGTDVLVVFCELEEKQGLIEDGAGAIFTAPHYDGHGSVLVRLADVGDEDLAVLLRESYLLRAPASLRATLGDPT
jgi:hypothetical protein